MIVPFRRGFAVAVAIAVSACAQPRYTRIGAMPEDLARDDAMCQLEALTTPPPYQSGLPEYGYGYPYGRRASAGDGAGLLLVVMIDRAATSAWRSELYKRCLLAIGYQPM